MFHTYFILVICGQNSVSVTVLVSKTTLFCDWSEYK
uniref:Uncharacterized protein n=1 Tax=Arundo donax TaxID=35708 RepID=A0A0A9BJR1_ARUDO